MTGSIISTHRATLKKYAARISEMQLAFAISVLCNIQYYKMNYVPNDPFIMQACFYVDGNELDLAECLRVLGHFRLA
jgi:hypothetical protein